VHASIAKCFYYYQYRLNKHFWHLCDSTIRTDVSDFYYNQYILPLLLLLHASWLLQIWFILFNTVSINIFDVYLTVLLEWTLLIFIIINIVWTNLTFILTVLSEQTLLTFIIIRIDVSGLYSYYLYKHFWYLFFHYRQDKCFWFLL